MLLVAKYQTKKSISNLLIYNKTVDFWRYDMLSKQDYSDTYGVWS